MATYEEILQMQLAQQAERDRLAGVGAGAVGTAAMPDLAPTRGWGLNLVPPGAQASADQVVSGGIPERGSGLELMQPGSYNPRLDAAPPVALQALARQFVDPKDTTPVGAAPGPSGITPQQLASLIAAGSRSAGGSGSAGVVDYGKIDTARRLQNDAFAKQLTDLDQSNQKLTLDALGQLKAPPSMSREAAAAELAKNSQMPQDTSHLRRVAANLPFWSDKLNGMDFSGARDHAMAVDKEERGALAGAMKMRQEGIDRQMGYKTGDMADTQKQSEFSNNLALLTAKAKTGSPDAIKELIAMTKGADTAQERFMEHNAAQKGANDRAALAANAAHQDKGTVQRAAIAQAMQSGMLSAAEGTAAIKQSYLGVPKEHTPPNAGLIGVADASFAAIPGVEKLAKMSDPRAQAIIQAYNRNKMADPGGAYAIAVKNVAELDKALREGR